MQPANVLVDPQVSLISRCSHFRFQTRLSPRAAPTYSNTPRLPPLHGQSHLASPTTTRGREGEGDGAEEAPEAGARRARLRLGPACPAAEEEGAEAGAGEAAGGDVRGASSCDVLPPGAAAQADARRPPTPSLQLVSCVCAHMLRSVGSSSYDACACRGGSDRTGLNFSNSVSATMNSSFEVSDSVLATRNLCFAFAF
jgi:hypothetical protein